MLMTYFEGLTTPKNRPLETISLGWSLWSGYPSKVKSLTVTNLKNGICAKNFILIYRLIVYVFKLSIHNLKALTNPVKIRYYKPEFMQVWQSDSLGSISHMVHEMNIKCSVIFLDHLWWEAQKFKSAKLSSTISRPNLNGFSLSTQHFRALHANKNWLFIHISVGCGLLLGYLLRAPKLGAQNFYRRRCGNPYEKEEKENEEEGFHLSHLQTNLFPYSKYDPIMPTGGT